MTATGALSRAIDIYYEAGWRLIPVVIDPLAASKRPASAGTIGGGGAWLTREEVKAGLVHGRGCWPGIGIRPEPGVLGIDIDNYDGRTGGKTIRDLSTDAEVLGWTGLGQLPATWRSSARPDHVSGIYWYRYDPGRWRPVRDVGINVELIRWNHRFGVASPTIHPNGLPYRWFAPMGQTCAPPRVTDLAWLPDRWLSHISSRHHELPGAMGGSTLTELLATGGWVREVAVASLSRSAEVMESAPEGSRNTTLFQLARDLSAAGLGTDDLASAAVRSGLSAAEVARTIRSAATRSSGAHK